MEQKIKKFHAYQLLNAVLLIIVIGLLVFALYPYFDKQEEQKEYAMAEKATVETPVIEKKEIEPAVKEIPMEPPIVQEKKGQTLEEAQEELLLKPEKPKLRYRQIQMTKSEKAVLPELNFEEDPIEGKEHIGDLWIRGVDCSRLDENLRIQGDLHVNGTGVERCWLPKGLVIVGSVYIKKVRSVVFQNDLNVRGKVYLEDDICVSIPLGKADNMVLSDGIKTCQ
ncbi:MAG: hypothetical protein JW812_00930 [Alphaproteobacteria bacterium]|nr:hypothetical protein [Alphaproteobacteria bacterium]MBN2780307.1 hypothetical protein [Alphaproteobacteria bacterium]